MDRLDGAVDSPDDMRHHQPLHRPLHRQSQAALEERLRLVIEGSGFGKVAQQVDVDMPGTALGQDGVDRAEGFDYAGRLSGADAEHDPAAALPHRLRRLDEAWLTVSGIEYEVGAPATGQLQDFVGDVVALVVENVMRARLPGQRHRLRRAAAANDQAGSQDARGHLHGEMPDTAPAARDIDGVAGLHSAVEARESGEGAHSERRPPEESFGV